MPVQRRTVPAATYIICTNPRSGSWLLSEGLASTSLAGNPREWFNTLEEQQHRARWRLEHATDLDYATYLRIAAAESTTSNGVSGIKLHYYQFAELPKRMGDIQSLRGLGSAQLLTRLFPRAKYVWLTRCDKVRQAISFLIASSTDEWWAIDGVTADKREDTTADPSFDPHAIERMERAFAENDLRWQTFFKDNDITPLVVHYEDLVADYAGTILRTLQWLGVRNAKSVNVPPTRLKRQANGRNEAWHKRYAAFREQHGESGGKSPVRAPTIRCPNACKRCWKRSRSPGSSGSLRPKFVMSATIRSSKC